MKKYRICGRKNPDCAASVSAAIKTAAGLEEVRVNMDTGEITYSPADCRIDEAQLKAAVEKTGHELEEIE